MRVCVYGRTCERERGEEDGGGGGGGAGEEERD